MSLLLWGLITASNFLIKSVVTVRTTMYYHIPIYIHIYIFLSCRSTLPLCQKHTFEKKTAHDFPTSSYAIAGSLFVCQAPLEEQLLRRPKEMDSADFDFVSKVPLLCSSLVDSFGRDWYLFAVKNRDRCANISGVAVTSRCFFFFFRFLCI